MRRVLRRIGIVLCALGLVLLVANAIAWRFLPAPSLLFQLDSELIFAPIPGARRLLVADDEAHRTVVTEIDGSGYRGPELASPKRGLRVAVYGDSLVMAETTPLEETFVERLGACLRAGRGQGVEVVNAGVTGYGPDQECLRLEREIDRLAPDLVVLVLCAHNDFGDLVRDKLFRFDESGKLIPNRWSLHQELTDDFAAKARAAGRPALVRALGALWDRRAERERRMAIQGKPKPPYMRWYLLAAKDEHTEFVLDRDDRVRSLFADYYDADVAIQPESASTTFKMKLMEAVLARLADDCRKRSVPLFAVVVPSAVDLCPDFEINVDVHEWPTWDPGALCRAFDEILARQGISSLDLSEAFRASNPCPTLFGRSGDFHWSSAGQDLAARVVADALAQHGLCAKGSK